MQTWQGMLQKLGHDWTLVEVKERVWGKNQEIFRRLFGDKYTDEEINDLSLEKEKNYIELYKDKIKFIDGFQEFISKAKERNIKLAIATAAPPITIDLAREKLKLEDYFEVIIDSEMVTKSKPDAEPYLKAADALGVNPSNCIVFEDAPVGVISARNAQMRSIVLETTHRKDEFYDFKNVVKIIKNYNEISVDECLEFIKIKD